MWFAYSDCHPQRTRTEFTIKCDRCRSAVRGTLPGYATDTAMRRAAAAQGWQCVTVTSADGKKAKRDCCPACRVQAGQRRSGATRAAG